MAGTKKLANKAAQPVQKAKAVTKQASKQATRKVQAGAGSLKDALNEDTGSTIGAAGVVGLAVVVAGALVLGSELLQPACGSLLLLHRSAVSRPVTAISCCAVSLALRLQGRVSVLHGMLVWADEVCMLKPGETGGDLR